MLIAVVQPAWALRCLSDGGADSLTEPIGGVASYPTDAQDGYVIWVSPPRTTTGYCYKDYGGDALAFSEKVYLREPENAGSRRMGTGNRHSLWWPGLFRPG